MVRAPRAVSLAGPARRRNFGRNLILLVTFRLTWSVGGEGYAPEAVGGSARRVHIDGDGRRSPECRYRAGLDELVRARVAWRARRMIEARGRPPRPHRAPRHRGRERDGRSSSGAPRARRDPALGHRGATHRRDRAPRRRPDQRPHAPPHRARPGPRGAPRGGIGGGPIPPRRALHEPRGVSVRHEANSKPVKRAHFVAFTPISCTTDTIRTPMWRIGPVNPLFVSMRHEQPLPRAMRGDKPQVTAQVLTGRHGSPRTWQSRTSSPRSDTP